MRGAPTLLGAGGEALSWGRARGGLACVRSPACAGARCGAWSCGGSEGRARQGGRVGWEGIAGLGLAARRAAEDFRSGFVCWTLAARREEGGGGRHLLVRAGRHMLVQYAYGPKGILVI